MQKKSEVKNNYLLALEDGDGYLVSINGFDQTFIVAVGGLVGDPAGLLRIIGLRLQLDLQLGRDKQPWGRVWIGSVGFLDISGHPGPEKKAGSSFY